jgi:hypothetical protein
MHIRWQGRQPCGRIGHFYSTWDIFDTSRLALFVSLEAQRTKPVLKCRYRGEG